jgi:hypothetical protein
MIFREWGGRLLRALLFAPLSTGAGDAEAHQKWLWPNVFHAAEKPVWISWDVSWSDRPFTAADGTGEQSTAVVHPDGSRASPKDVFVGKTKLTAEAELTKAGTYRIESVDRATYWTQLRVDGKEQWKQAPKNEVTGGEIVRSDLYYAEAVAFVTVGEATPLAAIDPNDPLEIRLVEHPSQLVASKPIVFQVMSYGKPAGQATVNVFDEEGDGHHPLAVVKCDDQGRGEVRLKAAGRHLLSCELEKAATGDPKADIYAFNAYVTIEVRE